MGGGTCPICGHNLINIMIDTYPPIPRKECTHCNWSFGGGTQEKIIRVPFQEIKPVDDGSYQRYAPISPVSKAYSESPCETCGNNPLNGGSGICNCTLGLPEIWG